MADERWKQTCERLRTALETAIESHSATADQLDRWVAESKRGGWSTHQMYFDNTVYSTRGGIIGNVCNECREKERRHQELIATLKQSQDNKSSTVNSTDSQATHGDSSPTLAPEG